MIVHDDVKAVSWRLVSNVTMLTPVKLVSRKNDVTVGRFLLLSIILSTQICSFKRKLII